MLARAVEVTLMVMRRQREAHVRATGSNARGLSRSVDMETVVLPEVTRRGGRLCHMGTEGVRERLG